MLIRDIDMDLPYIENKDFIEKLIKEQGIEKAEAIRIDYQENWKQKRMLFRDEIRCIAAMYLHFLCRFKTEKTKKILINCIVENCTDVVKTIDGFTETEVQLDISSYFKLSNEDKKKIILEKLNDGVLKVASYYQWDNKIFNHAHQAIAESGYKNEYVWKKKSSPSRKYIAEIYCRHEIDKYEIIMNIKTRDTTELLKSKVLIIERPNEFLFVEHLGDLKWESNTEVKLYNKYKSKKWTINIE